MTPTNLQDAIKRAMEREQPEWKAKFAEKMAEWRRKKVLHEQAKADEMRLRLELVEFAGNPELVAGSERLPLDDGGSLKITKVINYSFTGNDPLLNALQLMRDAGPVGPFLADRVVRWTPELCIGEYKKLPEDYKIILERVVVESKGTPSLEISPPKGTV